MISINTLKIDVDAENIEVDVNTVPGNTITKVLAWNSFSFKDPSKAIDLSSLLSGVDETETFSITAQDLGEDVIVGIWYLEFTDSEDNIKLGVTANLIPYHECILDKALKVEVKGCKKVTVDNCTECTDNLYIINTLLQSLNSAIEFGYFEEANSIVETLDELCEVCNTCPKYSTTSLIDGLGFATFNNTISSSMCTGIVSIPIANAGPDQTLENMFEGDGFTLDGSGSLHNSESFTDIQWEIISSPDYPQDINTVLVIDSPNELSTSVLIDYPAFEGVWVFKLTVTNDKGYSNSDEVVIVIKEGAT